MIRRNGASLGARLSPRRKLYAQRLLDHLQWHGRRVLLDELRYADLAADPQCSLDRFAVNQAVDDLYALGLVDVRLAGGLQLVIALAENVEDPA